MGYYAMMLDECIYKLCAIVLPQEKYMYQGLNMVIYIYPGVFQQKMSMLFQYMLQVFVIISNDTLKNNMDIIDYALNKFEKPGMKFKSVKWK